MTCFALGSPATPIPAILAAACLSLTLACSEDGPADAGAAGNAGGVGGTSGSGGEVGGTGGSAGGSGAAGAGGSAGSAGVPGSGGSAGTSGSGGVAGAGGAGGAGGSSSTPIVDGAFFVDCSADDPLADGSYEHPWNHLSDVNQYTFADGDDVYFKEGTRCLATGSSMPDGRLSIDWSGSIADPVVLGTYYEGPTGPMRGAGSAGRAAIDGQLDEEGPDGAWFALIGCSKHHDIVIENLILENAKSLVIETLDCERVLVDNAFIRHAWNQGVSFKRSDYSELRNSEVTDTNRVGNGANIRMQESVGVYVHHNVVHDTGCGIPGPGREGINLLHSDDTLVEYNTFYDSRGMGVYLDHAIAGVVRYNLIYYTDDVDCWRQAPDGPADGVVFNDENAQGTEHLATNNAVIGNLIAGTYDGISLWNGGAGGDLDPALINTVIAYNTIVEPYFRCFRIEDSVFHANSRIVGNVCVDSEGKMGTGQSAGLLWDYNLWSSTPTDPDLRGDHDPAPADPQLARASGWHTLGKGQGSVADFRPSSSGPVVDAATHLTTARSGGSGTVMPVQSAVGFWQETSNHPAAPAGELIRVDNPSSPDFEVRVVGANHANRTVTLANSQTWEEGAHVHLCLWDVCPNGAQDAGSLEAQ